MDGYSRRVRETICYLRTGPSSYGKVIAKPRARLSHTKVMFDNALCS